MPRKNIPARKRFIESLEDMGFHQANCWYSKRERPIDDTRTNDREFTLYQTIAEKEVASVLIMDYNDEYGSFEIFINASGNEGIQDNIESIRQRFDLPNK